MRANELPQSNNSSSSSHDEGQVLIAGSSSSFGEDQALTVNLDSTTGYSTFNSNLHADIDNLIERRSSAYQEILFSIFQRNSRDWFSALNPFIEGVRFYFQLVWPAALFGLMCRDVMMSDSDLSVIFIGRFGQALGTDNWLADFIADPVAAPVFLLAGPLVMGGLSLGWHHRWPDKRLAMSKLVDAENRLMNAETRDNAEEYQSQREAVESSCLSFYWLYRLGLLPFKNAHRFTHLFLGVKNLFLTYSFLRYFLSIAEFIDSQSLRGECQRSKGQWHALSSWGDSACTVCGDWPRMPDNAVFSIQDCVTTFLKTPRHYKEIKKRLLDAAQRYPNGLLNFSYDLTHQNWYQWPVDDLQFVLKQLRHLTNQSIASFNISVSNAVDVMLSANQTEALHHFISRYPVGFLNASGLGLTGDLPSRLLQNATLSGFDLSGCLRDAKARTSATHALQYLLDLKSLYLGHNQLRDSHLIPLSNFTASLPLQRLWLDHNQASALGMESVLANLPKPLVELVLSWNDLSGCHFDVMGNATQQLKHFGLAGGQLESVAMEALVRALSSAQGMKLDLSENQLDLRLLQRLLQRLSSLKLFSLLLSGNDLGDDVLNALLNVLKDNPWLSTLDVTKNALNGEGLSGLSDTAIQHLFLNQNILSVKGARILSAELQRRALSTLGLSGCSFSDEQLKILSGAWINRTMAVSWIDLGGNLITASGVRQWLSPMSQNTAPSHIILDGNELGANSSDVLISLLTQYRVKLLSVQNCLLTSNVMKNVAPHLPNMTVSDFRVSFNNFRRKQAIATFAAHLVSPPLDPAILMLPGLNTTMLKAINQSMPSSALSVFSAAGSRLDIADARTICYVKYAARLGAIDLSQNGFNVTQGLDPITCVVASSAASRPMPSLFLLCAFGVLFAFYDEVMSLVSLPSYLQLGEQSWAKNIGGFALRLLYSGPAVFAFDLTKAVKKACQKTLRSSEQAFQWSPVISASSKAALGVLLVYSVGYAINQITDYSWVLFGCFALIVGGRRIYTETSFAYARDGLFSAGVAGTKETVCALLPGINSLRSLEK